MNLASRWTAGALLALFVLTTRVPWVSEPYFADGPRHIAAIHDGSYFIQPPGYFLFAFSAKALNMVSGLSPAHAISVMNVAFSVAGVWMFHAAARLRFEPQLAWLLSLSYASVNCIWFSGLVHSTYASIGFFSPAVLYLSLSGRFVPACAVWAIGAGFRPSDGLFLLPLIFLAARSQTRSTLFRGAALAVTLLSTWYVPTAIHYGGILAPLAASHGQVASTDFSLLLSGFTPRAMGNMARFAVGGITSFHILLPFIVLSFVQFDDRIRWPCLAVAIPAACFFLLRFIADATYLVVLVAPLVLLAGTSLELRPARVAMAVLLAFVAVSSFHMLVLRPVAPTSFARRVVNSFSLQFTAWAAQNQYHRNLSDTERNATGREPNEFPLPWIVTKDIE